MGNLGFQELILLIVIGVMVIALPVYFIYKYGKTKGRLEEMERRIKEREV